MGMSVGAHELELYIDNDATLYRQQGEPILKNLATKKAKGVYNHDVAVKLYGDFVENGAKKYAKEHGGHGAVWHQMFPVHDRKQVAEAFARSFEVEYALGNYHHLLPKKYQKPATEQKMASPKRAARARR
jgi:hypothetical protein